ncbi:MAG TPA: winged helix-turn-helix domain-containing protein [Desulfosalsimonadaceae bacterium]|nr:winged helix-turn-helix domain-containing protein [Desulfosalsimonadaceae bacterium]
MNQKIKDISIRSKIWLADSEGKVVFGLGRLKMLEAIEQNGSIHGAAKDLGMSYRAVWGRIKATEDRLGEPLLHRNIGGRAGGGSELTDFARQLMQRFRKLHRLVIEESDQLFAELMPTAADQKDPSSI